MSYQGICFYCMLYLLSIYIHRYYIICDVYNYILINYITVSGIGGSLMLRYTEGATWAAIVSALVTPLAEMFWFFFHIPDGGDLEAYWNWNNSNLLIIVGLFFMAPFLFLYNKETQKQEQLVKEHMEYMNKVQNRYQNLENKNSSSKANKVLL